MATPPEEYVPMSARDKVRVTLLELQLDLHEHNYDENMKQGAFLQLRALGQSPDCAESLATKNALTIMSKYGLSPESSGSSRLALRCMANTLFLHEPARQRFVDLGLGHQAAEKLKSDDHEDEFIVARILFYLTYNTTQDFTELNKKDDLYQTLVRKIMRHSTYYYESGRRELSIRGPMVDMALAETLKLIFNLNVYFPQNNILLDPAIEGLINILIHYPLSTPPLQAPITHVLNALMTMDLGWSEVGKKEHWAPKHLHLFPHHNPTATVARLANILENAIITMPEEELDTAAATIVTLLRRLFHIGSSRVKWWMCKTLLPTHEDREKPLGQGDSLSARLLRLTTSPKLPTLRDNIAGMFWELNDKDSTKLINSIGFGYASGFLMRSGLDPQSALEGSGTPSEVDEMVNPITGQRLSAETTTTVADDVPWTDEEKQREAERLYVLFERLKATGVVDVDNPVTRRVEEVED